MEQIFYGLAVLACPLGMGAIMWVMMRSNKKPSDIVAAPEDSEAKLARLRADLDAALRAAQLPADSRPR